MMGAKSLVDKRANPIIGGVCGCLLCCSKDNKTLKSISNREDLLFVLKKVLQLSTLVPETLEVEENLVASPSRSSSLRVPGSLEVHMCKSCQLEIDGAKIIYKELLVAVKQFQEIQKRLWSRIKRGLESNEIGRDNQDNRTLIGANSESLTISWVERCRLLIAQNDYSEIDLFVVEDLEKCASNSFLAPQSPSGHEAPVKDEVESDIQPEMDETILFDLHEDAETSLRSGSDPEIRLHMNRPDIRGAGDRLQVSSSKNSFLSDEDDMSDEAIKSEAETDDSEDFKDKTDNEDISWNATENKTGDDGESSVESEDDWNESENEMKSNEKDSEIDAPSVKCDICNFPAKTQQGLKIHMSVKHNIAGLRKRQKSNQIKKPQIPQVERKHKCPEEGCGKSFSKPHQLRAHISRHTNEPHFTCSFCSERFYNSKLLLSHGRQFHPDQFPPAAPNPKKGPFPCDLCSKILSSSAGFLRHKQLIHNIDPPKEYKCSEEGCDKIYQRPEQLRDHLSKCHGREPYHKCTKCGEAFHTWKQKWRHEHKVHQDGLSQRPFVCEICGKGFSCLDYLITHRYKNHAECVPTRNWKNPPQKKTSDNSRVVCELCGKTFKNSLNLKNHVKVVHEKDKLKFACHLCNNRYLYSRLLNEHLFHFHQVGPEENRKKKLNTNRELFQCAVSGCRRRFYGDKARLDNHMVKYHGSDGKKPGKHKCKFCGKNFHTATKWRYHEMTHENKESKPFICDVCQKGFANPNNLQFHRKYTHKIPAGRPKHASNNSGNKTSMAD